jgi:hypothetical protein
MVWSGGLEHAAGEVDALLGHPLSRGGPGTVAEPPRERAGAHQRTFSEPLDAERFV